MKYGSRTLQSRSHFLMGQKGCCWRTTGRLSYAPAENGCKAEKVHPQRSCWQPRAYLGGGVGEGGGGDSKEQFMAIKDYTIIKTLPCLFVGQPTAESDGGEERASFWTVLLDAGLTHKQLLVGVVGVLDVRKEVRVVRRGCSYIVCCMCH